MGFPFQKSGGTRLTPVAQAGRSDLWSGHRPCRPTSALGRDGTSKPFRHVFFTGSAVLRSTTRCPVRTLQRLAIYRGFAVPLGHRRGRRERLYPASLRPYTHTHDPLPLGTGDRGGGGGGGHVARPAVTRAGGDRAGAVPPAEVIPRGGPAMVALLGR